MGEGAVAEIPANIHTTSICRKRPVFAGVRSKFMKREPEGLRTDRVEAQLGAIQDNARTNQIGEMRELGAHQLLDVNSLPLVPEQQVLIG
jgi:hypothetical protein